MSNVTSSILACENVQRELNNYFQTCGHEFQVRRSPLAEMITSPENRSGINLEVAPGNAKVKTVVMRYDQKVSASSVEDVTECQLDCSVDNSVGDMSKEYTIDTCEKIKYGESYNVVDFQNMCRTQTDFLNKRLMIMMNAMEEKAMGQIASEAILLQGNWASDVTTTGDVLRIDTRLSSNAIDPNWLIEFDFALQQTAYCTGVLVAGAPEFEKAARLMNAGCCNDGGADLLEIIRQYGKSVAWDPYVTTAFGSNSMSLATQLGALQLLTYTVGESANFEGFVNKGTNAEIIPLISPRLGLPIDLMVSVDCFTIKMIMTTSLKVVAAPLDMFPTGDVQSGVNYVNYVEAI